MKLYTLTKQGKPLSFGTEAKYSWTRPAQPLKYLKEETFVKDIKVKIVDFTDDTIQTIDALEFIKQYEDPRLKSANLAKILGRPQWKPYTIIQMKGLLRSGSLTEEQSELVTRYLDLWS